MFAPARAEATSRSRQAPHPFARAARSGPSLVETALAEPGAALGPARRARFEHAFGHDLSAVRVHSGGGAARSAAALSAQAYTFGDHIVLGRGAHGDRLIGHELAHVIQQRAGGGAPAGTPALEASADHAAASAARGERVAVTGASALGIACLSLFDEFTGGKYSWPILKLALTHTRPVATIIQDLNALPAPEREQAIKDIIAERGNENRKFESLKTKFATAPDQATKDVLQPVMDTVKAFMFKSDDVLDGLFLVHALGETRDSLKSGTTAPTLPKAALEDVLRPDVSTDPFEETLSSGGKSYLDKLREALPRIVEAGFQKFVVGKGAAEHKDPTKVRPLTDFNRVGEASKRETDTVFGQYKKAPALKADTRGRRGNIHDQWLEMEKEIKGMGAKARRDLAKALVAYMCQTTDEIRAINLLHHAKPDFKGGIARNQEAKDQETVATELTATPAEVKKLNEIDRGWPATAASGQINIQIFKKADETSGPLAGKDVAERDFLWDMFQTLIHEYIHVLVHKDYEKYADSFGSQSPQENTLSEGVDTLFDEIVWSNVEPKVNDAKLREEVEGPVFAKQPPIKVQHARRRHYRSYSEAIRLVSLVGIRNLYAAYFLGDVKKIKGV